MIYEVSYSKNMLSECSAVHPVLKGVLRDMVVYREVEADSVEDAEEKVQLLEGRGVINYFDMVKPKEQIVE